MITDLDEQFANIKKEHKEESFNKLNERIYSLDLPESFLSTLSQNKLVLIHVRLHNAIAYKKPFADFKKIKEAHDKVIIHLHNHVPIDILDEK